MTDLDKIRARLRALQAKTVEAGCTEAEALAAAEKMAELLSAHGLSADDLAAPEYCEHSIGLGRRSPLDKVWMAVAVFADCRGYYVRDRSSWSFAYFGRAQDVLVADYVHQVLRAACTKALSAFRESDTYRRRRKPSTRNQAVKAFLESLAAGLHDKLERGLWRRYGGPEDGPRARALITNNQATLKSVLEDRGQKFRPARALADAKGAFRDDAKACGHRAARAIDVNAGVAAGNKVAGVLG
ncbi:conserved protein of unknown function [Magnetospirillum sp. XM-1]|uniref:DUF7168 domain-containing protein n=1 Tax=Magnetospirillum sp. XM-1 TaxID=1663591 RepID=UPI00073E0CA3|nr:DUF2786 domain-containing protein [Magnetospirillum sp. XM-1]CUW41116.1 conserved protein of unknown function [Magnetospirillum sp. XM-1]